MVQKFMVEKSRVEKFMVEKSEVERSRVEMSFNLLMIFPKFEPHLKNMRTQTLVKLYKLVYAC